MLVVSQVAAMIFAVAVSSAAVGPAARPRPARPVLLAPADADSLNKLNEAERAVTQRWLDENPTSYLAATARRDFGNAPLLEVGRSPDCAVRLDDSLVAEKHLSVAVVGDSFRVVALSPGASFRSGDRELTIETLPPSNIGVGRYTLRLSHQRFPAIIVFDPQNRRHAGSMQQRWYPVNLRYRFVARLTPNPRADTTVIQSTRGDRRLALRAGWFDLLLNGKAIRLEAHRLLEPGVDEKSVSVFFRDATTGKETYEVGRYLEPERRPDGMWVLDFNTAYNPACAFSPHYNCPIPTKANTLSVPIRAGEMTPEGAGHESQGNSSSAP